MTFFNPLIDKILPIEKQKHLGILNSNVAKHYCCIKLTSFKRIFKNKNIPYFFFGRQPEARLHNPPVTVRPGTPEFGAWLQTFSYGGFTVRWKSLFDVVHFYSLGVVATAPKQAENKDLKLLNCLFVL